MQFVYSLVVLSCVLFEARGYPYPYHPSYGSMDTLSYGSSDNSRGGMVMSRYYNPYYNPRTVGGGMAAFMVRQPEEQTQYQSGQYYVPDRRRQTLADTNFNIPPQQNEVFYPQNPENAALQPENQPILPDIASPTEAVDLPEPTEKTEVISTTLKAVSVPELAEPEVEEAEEPVPKAKKVSSKRKQVKRPIDDEDEEEAYPPRMPAGAFFPMFFGYGRTSGGPGGPTAIANAYSTGRGGVATSHATAYGAPRPEEFTKKV